MAVTQVKKTITNQVKTHTHTNRGIPLTTNKSDTYKPASP